MSTLKVDGIRSNSASSDAITLASDGTCTAKVTNKNNKNLITNGSCIVAQRGTSSTTSGYNTVDRFRITWGGQDEVPTIAQADVASGTPAYQAGFRKCLKITNGNQTSGADAGDHIQVDYYIEAQDLANSGWDYTSSSSYVTLSFWIKSSVAQAFPATFHTQDGTQQVYNMTTGTLSANTWTKVSKTIPGNSNLQFDNNNDKGCRLMFFPHIGTTYTTTGLAMDTWSAWTNPKHSFDMATGWWTTNDATWEITGLQLEVSDHATDFEHRSYGQELQLCKRYYQKWCEGNSKYVSMGAVTGATEVLCVLSLPVPMRGTVAIDHTNGNDYWRIAGGNLGGDKYIDGAWTIDQQQPSTFAIYATPDTNLNSYLGESGYVQGKNASSYMAFESEL